MNETEWLACDNPMKMLDFLQGSAWRRRLFGWLDGEKERIRQRKYRLYICACCRTHKANLGKSKVHLFESAVEVGERFADGLATRRELRATRKALEAAAIGLTGAESWWETFQAQLGTSSWEIDWELLMTASAAEPSITDETVRGASPYAEYRSLGLACALLRDLFGNPFRLVRIAPGWLTPAVVSIARTIYDDRRYEDLPILADALEEAGCVEEQVLAHCRSGGLHVRGCWVLDGLLGKQ